ncbi:hypothetical protein GLOTRDRAFT_138885 [Gloeophyllum trabeum ATCC 11539]|uniref:Zn(2)-C6 fungal-type domain-containing protein n=1 Tax=Gloeophyllum trabeum (strain ATCC 11539 / FP-39264 / Madison 617) TaxID=670483 RepID=S7Q5G5_GLOTA|nr:uncharacterized protein GLOTRDRAFT_138885 [Gloeophyllum trabeum ATCC 11539]EPQ55291.1 hypothetical protein GLOTRDRAFT_138885 [Gloeophyllum trabeum ATCC 11539]
MQGTSKKDAQRAGYGPARVSCEECRRMKSRCDKQRPCGPCIRRGCADICPNGTLPTRRVFRSIYADKEALQQKIEQLCHRIQDLEDAIRAMHSKTSSENHPLLSEQLLSIKVTDRLLEGTDSPYPGLPPPEESLDSVNDAFGTLTIGDDGRAKFFGRSAGPEILFQGLRSEDDSADGASPSSQRRGRSPARGAAEPALYDDETLAALEAQLPSEHRASALCESYLEHSSWFFGPIQRDELVHELLAPVYASLSARTYNPLKLAVLFFVLAHGALADLSLPPYNAEAEGYYRAGASMLSMRNIVETPTIETVQAFAYMSVYNVLCEKRYGLGCAWPLIHVAVKLSQAIGLHLDSSYWQLDETTIHRRRMLFWELVSQELPMSLSTGRPPSTHWDFANCKIPTPERDQVVDLAEEYNTWRYTFNRDIWWQAVKLTISGQAPSYRAILDLDRKLGSVTMPAALKAESEPGELDYYEPAACMRSLFANHIQYYVRMYIHRPFFAKAFLDYPADPVHSPYGVSVMTTYRTALLVLKSLTHFLQRAPILCQRFFFVWLHAFSAAIVVAFIATKSPNPTIARGAFDRLNAAIELFEKGAAQNHRVQISLPILRELREKAYLKLSRLPSAGEDLANLDDDDHLATFVGRTKFMLVASAGRSPRSSTGSPDSRQDDMDSRDVFADSPNIASVMQSTFEPGSLTASLSQTQPGVTQGVTGSSSNGGTPQELQDPLFSLGASYEMCRSYLDIMPGAPNAAELARRGSGGSVESLLGDGGFSFDIDPMTFFSEAAQTSGTPR